MHRNSKSKPLIPNGGHRPGQQEWHDANCLMEDHGIVWSHGTPHRALWCATHGQWAIEVPVSVNFVFEDGETLTRKY